MKNVVIALVMLCSFSLAAQGLHPEKNSSKRPQTALSAEQQASLNSKRMTLSLDLSSEQQQSVEKILTDHIRSTRAMHAQRIAMKEAGLIPGPDQRYEHINAQLEEQIAFQNSMKDILSETQYSKWKKLHRAKQQAKMRHGARR